MSYNGSAVLRELELWLNANVAEAERLLPDILDVPATLVRQELRMRPELRTAGMIQRRPRPHGSFMVSRGTSRTIRRARRVWTV
jgi:hypothetical protein